MRLLICDKIGFNRLVARGRRALTKIVLRSYISVLAHHTILWGRSLYFTEIAENFQQRKGLLCLFLTLTLLNYNRVAVAISWIRLKYLKYIVWLI